MRLVSYLTPVSTPSQPRLGALLPERATVVDLQALGQGTGDDLPLGSMLEMLQAGPPALDRIARLIDAFEDKPDDSSDAVRALASVQLMAPIPRPGKILCAGVNYRDHLTEVPGRSAPRVPSIFSKLPSVVVGPYDDIIHPGAPHTVDYEVELAIVIGARAHRVSRDRALQFVAGCMIMNDVSARDVQFFENQLTMGKNFDTFAPMGPCLVTLDELGDPQDLEIVTKVNGEVRQRARTSKMLFDIPALIEWVSHACTLEPGDVIATGTPAGVGAFRHPPIFLQPDDIVRREIEHLGAIENRVVNGGPCRGPHLAE
jgi:2-keto-4-pentenoate hydratase/2-oxohepta-3-ene-1,7-dioic acid hydratase in catechol pathway